MLVRFNVFSVRFGAGSDAARACEHALTRPRDERSVLPFARRAHATVYTTNYLCELRSRSIDISSLSHGS